MALLHKASGGVRNRHEDVGCASSLSRTSTLGRDLPLHHMGADWRQEAHVSFVEDNAAYEAWLRTQCAVVDAGLTRKHARMRRNSLSFLRATFFRWCKLIEIWFSELKGAPAVLAVGDAHIENFGTWRDAEGRLVWGINDFDDACLMPYA